MDHTGSWGCLRKQSLPCKESPWCQQSCPSNLETCTPCCLPLSWNSSLAFQDTQALHFLLPPAHAVSLTQYFAHSVSLRDSIKADDSSPTTLYISEAIVKGIVLGCMWALSTFGCDSRPRGTGVNMFLWKAGVHLVASQLSVQLNENRIRKPPGKIAAW